LVELTAPVVFVTVPACVGVTFTEIVQLVPGVAIVPPVKLMLVELAVAVTVPLQVFVTPGVEATWSPFVSVSEKAMPFSAEVFAAGLVIVKVSVVVLLTGTFPAPKAFEIVGGATTVSVAVLLVVPVPPSVEVIGPVVLLLVPGLLPVTSTEMLHVDPAPGDAVNVPPDKLMLPLPPAAVTVPPQELVMFGVEATTKPEGKLSLKASPLSALAVFGLAMAKLTEVVPFKGMLAAPNALLMVGGAPTVKLAFVVLPFPASVEVT
jgi:hypothetical protein